MRPPSALWDIRVLTEGSRKHIIEGECQRLGFGRPITRRIPYAARGGGVLRADVSPSWEFSLILANMVMGAIAERLGRRVERCSAWTCMEIGRECVQ